MEKVDYGAIGATAMLLEFLKALLLISGGVALTFAQTVVLILPAIAGYLVLSILSYRLWRMK